MELILGSSSPRRREILSYFSLPFRCETPDVDESATPFLGDPKAYVTTLALEKAHNLHAKFPGSACLTADTVVFVDGKILGKPKDKKEMVRMLQILSGSTHSVFTALAVINPHRVISRVEETRVICNILSNEEIEKYINGHILHDKAGGYAIQGSGSLLVREIHGCYYNVMGMPINTLRALLLEVGIDLMDWLR
jgi:septum formation protein